MVDPSILKSDYCVATFITGTIWAIISEILRKSTCQYNSLGHFIFSDMSLCGRNVTVDVHIHDHEPNETTPLAPATNNDDAVALHVNI